MFVLVRTMFVPMGLASLNLRDLADIDNFCEAAATSV